jgi:hypothetical protein
MRTSSSSAGTGPEDEALVSICARRPVFEIALRRAVDAEPEIRVETSMALFLRLTAYPASAKDPDLFRAVARRVNLLDPPDAMEHDPTLIERARQIAAEAGQSPPMGPARSELPERIRAG